MRGGAPERGGKGGWHYPNTGDRPAAALYLMLPPPPFPFPPERCSPLRTFHNGPLTVALSKWPSYYNGPHTVGLRCNALPAPSAPRRRTPPLLLPALGCVSVSAPGERHGQTLLKCGLAPIFFVLGKPGRKWSPALQLPTTAGSMTPGPHRTRRELPCTETHCSIMGQDGPGQK